MANFKNKKYTLVERQPNEERVPRIYPPPGVRHIVELVPNTQLQLESPLPSRYVRRYSRWLVHVRYCSGCTEPQCRILNRTKNHVKHCKIKMGRGCSTCLNLRKIKHYHIRHCHKEKCPLLNCMLHKINRFVTRISNRDADLQKCRQMHMTCMIAGKCQHALKQNAHFL